MGTDRTTWIDGSGEMGFWKGMPLNATKKAFFNKGSTIVTLAKLTVNSITYDFTKTARNGVVIVPPDYSVIEFISPDGLIDYQSLLGGNLGGALSHTIALLRESPVKAWDEFVKWLNGTGVLKKFSENVTSCTLQTIDDKRSVVIDMPDFTDVPDMVSFLDSIKNATVPAHGDALSLYQLDTASFGWKISITIELEHETDTGTQTQTSSFSMGYLFRE